MNDCKGRVYRYEESRFVRRSGAVVTEKSFVPVKKLSCKGCEFCGGFDECIDNHIYDSEIEAETYEHGQLYRLMINSYLCNRPDDPPEYECELSFIKMEG